MLPSSLIAAAASHGKLLFRWNSSQCSRLCVGACSKRLAPAGQCASDSARRVSDSARRVSPAARGLGSPERCPLPGRISGPPPALRNGEAAVHDRQLWPHPLIVALLSGRVRVGLIVSGMSIRPRCSDFCPRSNLERIVLELQGRIAVDERAASSPPDRTERRVAAGLEIGALE